MTTPSSDVKSTYPPNNSLRIGTARSTNGVVTVEVSGEPVNCGFLDPGGYIEGAPVPLLRGESSWLALGACATQPVSGHLSTTFARATASLTLTTVETAITGALVNVTVGATSQYHVIAVWDFEVSVAAATLAVGGLTIDTVVQTGRGVFGLTSSVGRATVTQQFFGSIAAGDHAFQLTALKSVNVGTLAAALTNTTISVRIGA